MYSMIKDAGNVQKSIKGEEKNSPKTKLNRTPLLPISRMFPSGIVKKKRAPLISDTAIEVKVFTRSAPFQRFYFM